MKYRPHMEKEIEFTLILKIILQESLILEDNFFIGKSGIIFQNIMKQRCIVTLRGGE